VGDGNAISNSLQKHRREQGDRLRVIEAKSASEALLSEGADLMEQDFVDIPRGKMHGATMMQRGAKMPGEPATAPPAAVFSKKTASGSFRVRHISGRSRLVEAFAEAPLFHRAPRGSGASAAENACWLYLGHLGGGYLPGDSVELRLFVEAGATLVVLAQSSAKVFRGSSRSVDGNPTRIRTVAEVAPGGTLVLLPDPVVPFADACIAQECILHTSAESSVFVWDPFTAGRVARGERWAFRSFTSRTKLVEAGRVVHHDALVLDGDDGPIHRRTGAGTAQPEAFGSLLASGPRFATLASALVAQGGELGGESRFSCAYSAGSESRVVGRLATLQAGALSGELRKRVGAAGLFKLLGGDPFASKVLDGSGTFSI
jgi:urease accessory protein